MPQNLVSQTMTDAQRDALLADLASFDTKFSAFKVALTPEQIGRLAKISEADMAVLELALTFARQNPGALPADLNVDELAGDLALAKQVAPIKAKSAQQTDTVSTTQVAALSDALKSALTIYRIAQAQGRTPQNQAFLDGFGQRFARGPRGGATPPTPNPPSP